MNVELTSSAPLLATRSVQPVLTRTVFCLLCSSCPLPWPRLLLVPQRHAWRTVSVRTNHYPLPKLQALVYDILPWRKVPESDARSVPPPLTASAEKCPRPLTPFCSFTSSDKASCVALVRMSSFSNCSFLGSSWGSSTNLVTNCAASVCKVCVPLTAHTL